MNVLIVEDNPEAAQLLRQAVTEAGYAAEVTGDGRSGLHAALSGEFDLILLDVMLPVMDGLALSRALRAADITTPILMLTARDTTEATVEGLDSGADDYLVKPFRIAELYARMRALLRRGNIPIAALTTLTVGDLTLDPASRIANRGGKAFTLSATEYKLLEHLMRHSGQILTRSALLDYVWQYDFGGNDNVLDVYISYLRGKIDKGHFPPLIQTVRGVGYRIGVPSEQGEPRKSAV